LLITNILLIPTMRKLVSDEKNIKTNLKKIQIMPSTLH